MSELIRTYSELRRFDTFEDRFNYLVLGGTVGNVTFGFDRWVNQYFYTTREWRDIRNGVIIRDGGCDLGIPGYEINGALLVHHINPMESKDVENHEDWILNPEFLITTTHDTHNAIHYGDRTKLRTPYVERRPGDTKLW